MRDLFTRDRHFEPIAMPDADVSILHGIAAPFAYDVMLRRLLEEIIWRQESIKIFGKLRAQPRLVAWYGDPGMRYSYSGISLKPSPWTDLLRDIKHEVEACTGASFNSVLLNLYRDHRDSMGLHSDDEAELGIEPVIASVSFGETRTLVMKHKTDRDVPTHKVALEAGTVLLMQGQTQRHWKHAILKQTKPCGPRINLTFRTILNR